VSSGGGTGQRPDGKRQAGSTLKPFLYGLALDRVDYPGTLIDDSPLDIPVANGIYRPMNYDTDFRGLVSARTALASSLNVPAVKVLQLTGVANFHKALEDLGLEGWKSRLIFTAHPLPSVLRTWRSWRWRRHGRLPAAVPGVP
jgi:penicillin-binding protein 1C